MPRKTIFALLLLLLSVCLWAQETYVFFGSYNWDAKENGIYIYNLNTANGTLTHVNSVKGMRNPSYLTLSADGNTLYSVTDSKTPNAGSVSSFAFDRTKGTLTFINSQPSKGENPVYVSVHPSGKWLAEANYTKAGFTIYPINSDGSIGNPQVNIGYSSGGSINPKRQEQAHVHSAVFSPDGNYLFLPDLGADKIHGFAFNADEKKPLGDKPLNREITTTTPPGSGPRHFTFHPNGKWAYCIEEISGSISAYEYNNGTLQSFQRVFTHPDDLVSDDYEGSDIHISPDGKFLYATSRREQNNIAIFSIDSGGRLTLLGYESTRGLHPRTFAIDASGRYIIVANVNSDSATVFSRNAATGLLTYIQTIENLPHITTVQIHTYK